MGQDLNGRKESVAIRREKLTQCFLGESGERDGWRPMNMPVNAMHCRAILPLICMAILMKASVPGCGNCLESRPWQNYIVHDILKAFKCFFGSNSRVE